MKGFLLFFFVYCLALSVYCQDTRADLYSQALKILDDSERRLNRLEESATDYLTTTSGLLEKTSSMQTIIEQQQMRLRTDWQNYILREQEWSMKSGSYEQTIKSLSESYSALQVSREKLREENGTLEKRILKRTIVIIILSFALAGALVLLFMLLKVRR